MAGSSQGPRNISPAIRSRTLFGTNFRILRAEALFSCPGGPSTQYLRCLVPNTIKNMVFGTTVLKYWVLGPSGLVLIKDLA